MTGIAFSLLVVALANPVRQATDPKELLDKVFAAWEARQGRITSLICASKVDSFYPRGFMSNKFKVDFGKEIGRTAPDEDTTFHGQPASWTIDFAHKRVRKEYQLTLPMFDRV